MNPNIFNDILYKHDQKKIITTFDKEPQNPDTETSFKSIILNIDEVKDFDWWKIDLNSGKSFVYNNKTFNNGDLIYYIDGDWYTIPDISNFSDDDILFDKKYLSVLIDKFFDSDIIQNYPNFIKIIKGWLEQCDFGYTHHEKDKDGKWISSQNVDGFWKIINELEGFGDIDRIPDGQALLLALSQYSIQIYQNIKQIPYFYNDIDETYNYNNIRYFLRVSKLFAQSKGSPTSLFFFFKLIQEKLEIRFPYKQIIKLSEISPVYNEDGTVAYTEDEYGEKRIRFNPSSVINGNENIKDIDSLCHIQGYDEFTGIRWAPYTLILKTNYSATFGKSENEVSNFRSMIEEILKPVGVEFFWRDLKISDVKDTTSLISDDDIITTPIQTKNLIFNIQNQEDSPDFDILLIPNTEIPKFINDKGEWKFIKEYRNNSIKLLDYIPQLIVKGDSLESLSFFYRRKNTNEYVEPLNISIQCYLLKEYVEGETITDNNIYTFDDKKYVYVDTCNVELKTEVVE